MSRCFQFGNWGRMSILGSKLAVCLTDRLFHLGGEGGQAGTSSYGVFICPLLMPLKVQQSFCVAVVGKWGGVLSQCYVCASMPVFFLIREKGQSDCAPSVPVHGGTVQCTDIVQKRGDRKSVV